MKQDNQTTKYQIYTRKSTEGEDRQILSLPAQMEEMKLIANREQLKIYKTYSEARSAQIPNKRTDFNEMVENIKTGKAQGILCWKLDRLARNPDEAGLIMGMLQRREITHIKTSEKDYYPEDNSLISYVEFGMANQFSRDLSKNVKRGIDQKANKGKRPTLVPLGYKNTKTHIKGEQDILIDPLRFNLVKQLWQYMLTGNYTVPQILKIANEELHLTQPATKRRPERKIILSVLYNLFTNPFYYGWFEWPKGSGNWIQGSHEPIISEKEFDQVQKLLGRVGRPRPKEHKFAFTGLIRCGSCGAMITAEEKIKRQKNGKVHHYIYYHCTRKINSNCAEKSIEIAEFNKQVDKILEGLNISDRFQKWALRYLHEIRQTEAKAQENSFGATQEQLNRVNKQLDNLVLKYTSPENSDGSIFSDNEFKSAKSELLKQKTSFEEQLQAQGKEKVEWLELSEKTFNFARYAKIWFEKGNHETRRAIFACLGSDLLLKDQKISLTLRKPFKFIFEGLSHAEAELLKLEPLLNTENIIDYRVLSQKIPVWSG